MTEKRKKRTFTEEFKKQLVELHNNGKPRAEIIREYDLTASAFDKWVSRINATASSREADNRTPEQEELLLLRKENIRLKRNYHIQRENLPNNETARLDFSIPGV